jgi:hypothetical protein
VRRGELARNGSAPAAVLQMYWAAAGLSWRFAQLSAQSEDPLEKEKLAQLRQFEEERMALARNLMAELWGIRIERPAA